MARLKMVNRVRIRNIIPAVMAIMILLQFLTPLSFVDSQSGHATSGRGAVVSIDISPQDSLSIDADSQIQFTATMYDSDGDQVLGSPDWWTDSGTIDAGGLFTPNLIGSAMVHASKDGVNESVNLTVTAGWPDSILIETESLEIMIGSSAQINATMLDKNGNHIDNRPISWMADCGNISSSGLWTPVQVGTCTITAHWNELHTSINISATPGSPAVLIIPSGLSVRSGESISVAPTLQDTWGNELALSEAGTLLWSIASGSVTSGNMFLADEPGTWLLNVSSSSGASGSTTIIVQPAAINGLELIGPSSSVKADEEVEFIVQRTDVFGHVTNETVPLSNWTLEDGSLKMSGNSTIWVPNQVGTWNISVSLDGYTDSVMVEVLHGWATSLVLAAESDRLSADEQTVIWMQASDSRNNRWVVNGSWEPVESEVEDWIEDHDSWARFIAATAGNWTIEGEWFDTERQILLSSSITIEVIPGEVASITLAGEGETLSIDESLNLNPVLHDGDGNSVAYALLNWTVIKDGVEEDRTVDLRLTKGVFHPEETGSHEIRARTGSAHSSVRFHVNHGQARTMSVNLTDTIQVTSGSSGAIVMLVMGTDLSGQTFEIDEMEWQMDPEAGIFYPHPSGLGKWYFEGYKVGVWEVSLLSGQASLSLSIEVIPGPIHRLEANLSAAKVEQGEELLLTIRAYDERNNSVPVFESTVSVHSTAGNVEFVSSGVWKIETEEGGENHGVTIRHDNLTQQRFFDVNSALLGGIFGSSNGALVVGSSLILVLLVVLVVIRRRMMSEEEGEFLDESQAVMREVHEQYRQLHDNQQGYLADEYGYSQQYQQPQAQQQQPQAQQQQQPQQPQQQAVAVVSQPANPQLSAAEMAAQRARETGVMVAAQGTIQGQSGWYYDSSGELTCWNVDEAGNWSRIQ